MTDQMIPLVKRDEEIEGVFAHEMSHVDRAHGLQRIYQASIVPAAIASSPATPASLVISPPSCGYPVAVRLFAGFEQRPTTMRLFCCTGWASARHRWPICWNAWKEVCGHDGAAVPTGWLPSATAERAARLRKF